MDYILMLLVLVVLVGLFLLQPGRVRAAQVKPFEGRNYAHRGLHTKDKSIPENSLPAFAAAVQAGYGMELDVQLSKDGKLVVFHDDTLERVTGVQGRVDAYDWEELQEMKLCGSQERMPLFRELLETVGGKTPLIVELKSGPRNRELCEKTLEMLRDYEGDFCVESFDPTIVAWFKKNAPDILRGQLADSYAGYRKSGAGPVGAFVLSRCLGNCIARPQFIAWGPNKKNAAVKFAEMFGPMKVFWTAHPEMDLEKLQSEYDSVIFEFYTPPAEY